MKNPLTAIGQLITGGGTKIIVDAGQELDQKDVLRGLTEDIMSVIADRYKLAGQITGNRVEFTLERKDGQYTA